MGIVAEVITNNTRKPLWGYRLMVYSIVVLGFLSFVVWAHHMFLTGMGTTISAFFQTTTMIISIPSVIILSSMILSLYGGSIRFTTPMLFALAFLPMFGIGGLTGLPLGLAATDIPLHDTYYVVGHFHYLVAPGTIFALFAGVYHWFPKITGRMMNDVLGRIHFVGSLIRMNVIFAPMFIQGLAGVNRRLWDGGTHLFARPGHALPERADGARGAGAGALPDSVPLQPVLEHQARPRGAGANPWQATTLEWAAPTPPLAHGNFPHPVRAYRDPYDYSVPGAAADFTPQNAASTGRCRMSDSHDAHMEIPYTTRGAARHRPHQPEARDLAVPGVGGDALRLAVFVLRAAADRRRHRGPISRRC